jgi:hypothetical protein
VKGFRTGDLAKFSIGSPQYLGAIRHPAIGIRIPEIFLTGILRAYKKRNVAGGLMLSFGRETAPESVIESAPGSHEITRGHTGTSIKKYMTMGAEAALREGVVVEIEADHIIVIGSSTRAVKRIAGVHEEGMGISEAELSKSLQYNTSAVDEALSTGYVNCFTVDASDLLDPRSSSLDGVRLRGEFQRSPMHDELLSRYVGRTFEFRGRRRFSLRITETKAMRLALRYGRSIAVSGQIYDYIGEGMGRPFGFEISLDETKERTEEEELLYYLSEWKSTGRHVDFVAPNIGFRKRTDFHGDLRSLEGRVARLSEIARSFGAFLSIHSGSGTTPYSGKGRGTYGALLRGSGGDLKYKISGVYYELLLQILASHPPRSKERELYNRIFDAVYGYLTEQQVAKDGPLASNLLERQISAYRRGVKGGRLSRRTPRAVFFRFNSYLALNLRDERGRRYLRDGLVGLYRDNPSLRTKVDEEAERLTTRLLDGLGYGNNVQEIPEALRSRA